MTAKTATINDLHRVLHTDIQTASGVSLTSSQRKHVGIVLDLFCAHPSLWKLEQFTEDAVHEDAFATAKNWNEIA